MRASWLTQHPALAASAFGRLLAENSPVQADPARRALQLATIEADAAFQSMRERYRRRLGELRAVWLG